MTSNKVITVAYRHKSFYYEHYKVIKEVILNSYYQDETLVELTIESNDKALDYVF